MRQDPRHRPQYTRSDTIFVANDTQLSRPIWRPRLRLRPILGKKKGHWHQRLTLEYLDGPCVLDYFLSEIVLSVSNRHSSPVVTTFLTNTKLVQPRVNCVQPKYATTSSHFPSKSLSLLLQCRFLSRASSSFSLSLKHLTFSKTRVFCFLIWAQSRAFSVPVARRYIFKVLSS